MNFKKFVSGVSAFTLAVSTFASMAVVANADEGDIVKEATIVSMASKANFEPAAGTFYINYYATGSGLGYVHFSIEKGNISNAVLTMNATSASDRSRNVKIEAYGVSEDKCLKENVIANGKFNDWYQGVYFIGQTEEYQIRYLTTPKALSIDCTAYLQQLEGTDAYVCIAAPGNLAVDSTVSDIKLTVTYSAAEQVGYTVKYVGPDGEEIKDADISRKAPAGSAIELTDDDKETVYANDKKYTYVSDDSEGATIAEDGSTVVTVTFAEAAKYTATVNATVDGETIKTYTADQFEGDRARVFYSKYLELNGKYYETTANGGYPTYAKDLYNAEPVNVEYTAADVDFAAEVEDLTPSHSWAANGGQTDRYSKGNARRLFKNSYFTVAKMSDTDNTVCDLTLWARNGGSGEATLSVYLKDADGNLTDTGLDFPSWGNAIQGERTVSVAVPAGSAIVIYHEDPDWNTNLEADYVTVKITESTPAIKAEGIRVTTTKDTDSYNTLVLNITNADGAEGTATYTFAGAVTITKGSAVIYKITDMPVDYTITGSSVSYVD